ncbi:DoxX family protein [Metabacillus kandeliae]|uniref:DoxX family protein n=1 Tax=Metabacillus kandeliae TaxID=2900151 RepID=UPI0038CC14CB
MAESKGRLWVSYVFSWLVILFMLFDSIMKFVKPAEVVKGTASLGFKEHHLAVIGLLGLISVILYLLPRTSFFGALLLTGYFGGVMAVQVRLDAPLFSHILFPVYLAILMWGGLWLRDSRVRNLFLQGRQKSKGL